jgi:hypothetical protein
MHMLAVYLHLSAHPYPRFIYLFPYRRYRKQSLSLSPILDAGEEYLDYSYKYFR